MRALLALRAYLGVAAHLRDHCEGLCRLGFECMEAPPDILAVLRQFELSIKAYHSSTEALDQKAQGVLELVSAVRV